MYFFLSCKHLEWLKLSLYFLWMLFWKANLIYANYLSYFFFSPNRCSNWDFDDATNNWAHPYLIKDGYYTGENLLIQTLAVELWLTTDLHHFFGDSNILNDVRTLWSLLSPFYSFNKCDTFQPLLATTTHRGVILWKVILVQPRGLGSDVMHYHLKSTCPCKARAIISIVHVFFLFVLLQMPWPFLHS